MEKEKPVILFDGVCNLCNSSVNFVIRRDREKKFRFAPLQSEKCRELLEKHDIPEDLDTLILLEEDDYYMKSSAYIRILDELGGIWRIPAALMKIIPPMIGDAVYDLVARYRYRVFGKKDVCMVPSEDIKDRFVSENSSW